MDSDFIKLEISDRQKRITALENEIAEWRSDIARFNEALSRIYRGDFSGNVGDTVRIKSGYTEDYIAHHVSFRAAFQDGSLAKIVKFGEDGLVCVVQANAVAYVSREWLDVDTVPE